MKIDTSAFGSYDIRGVYPETINENLAYRIGRTFPLLVAAKKVVVGNDIRKSGPALKQALCQGLTDAGCHVIDIGQCGTEMIYFATFFLETDGGIMITASHNPKEYNGMKFVQKGAYPIGNSTGLCELKKLVEGKLPEKSIYTGRIEAYDITEEYVQHILSYVDVEKLKPLKIVVNPGNGAAGPILEVMEKYLPFNFVKLAMEPDGNFPNGVPNPLLPDKREMTIKAVCKFQADIGIAWDGDFDRCFIFDEKGTFIDGYYIVGFLAQEFLQKNPGATIVCDPRVNWNTIDIVKKNGGVPVVCKSGHTHIKKKMRDVDAIYGGEMSAHHYFRDFAYCDSGMIPWLLIMELLSQAPGVCVSELFRERMEMYPISGEINNKVNDPEAVLKHVEDKYGSMGEVSKIDGISVEFENWRFNLRKSNTESLIRLNLETYRDRELLQEKTAELLMLIRNDG